MISKKEAEDLNAETVARISELSRKSRTEQGLTDSEKAEQAALRAEYLTAVTGNFKAQLENVEIIEPDGKKSKLKKKK
ncbi:MAG: DUF896 domain-containing protein [Oscillospiraceae bacterium]